MKLQDENDNEEGEEDSLPANSTMETDSVDYPHLIDIPCANTSTSTSTTAKGRKHPFLQRSDSTLCLGCPPLDPFDTNMSEALPLADQPHLLQPHSRREDLFGVPRQSGSGGAGGLDGLPTRLGLSTRNAEGQLSSATLILGHSVEQISKSQNQERRSEAGSSRANVGFFQ